MFTGIIEAALPADAAVSDAEGMKLMLSLPADWQVKLGDSIAINGCCLTIAELEGECASFIAVPETLKLTNLGDVNQGDLVNLERAMVLGSRLDGHIVQGHVDGIGTIASITEAGEERRVRVNADKDFCAQCVHKGSVCVNGISLTIAELEDTAFTVAIVPHTWKVTNLQSLKEGSKVNLEADLIGKYVRRAMGS